MQFKNAAKKFFSNLIVIEIGIIILLVLVGSTLFYIIEKHTYLDSMYFMMMTMSTIGYGDITPTTGAGKILVMVYSFMGVPLFVSLSGLILESRFNKVIKGYITKFHKEMHNAEEEIRLMEEKVSKEIETIMENTQEKVDSNKKEINKIEHEIIEQEVKKPRWKRIFRR